MRLVRFMLWRTFMIHQLQYRGPVFLIAASVGWTVLALIFGWLGEAGVGSVLWPAIASSFVLLAILGWAAALVAIVWRLVAMGHGNWFKSLLRRVPPTTILL